MTFWYRFLLGLQAILQSLSAGLQFFFKTSPNCAKKFPAYIGGPLYIILPSDIKIILSNLNKSSADGWCIVARMLMPLSASSLRHYTTRKAEAESRPLVGSSSKSKDGFVISSYAIEVRFLSPPDMPLCIHPPIYVSWQSVRPSLCSTDLTRSYISGSLSFVRILAENSKTSLGV